MKFIALTDSEGEPIYVNLTHIVAFNENGDDGDTQLHMITDSILTVGETRHRLISLLNAAGLFL